MSNEGMAVTPSGMGHGYEPPVSCIESLLPDSAACQPVIGQQKSAALAKRLVNAAQAYLGKAGISMPHATLEVTKGGEVVMHGVPNSGQILVCAQTEAGIQNYL